MGLNITREDAVAYRERWRLVRERQLEETRHRSPEERFRRLALLVRVALGLPDPRRTGEDAVVRARWQRLRERLLG